MPGWHHPGDHPANHATYYSSNHPANYASYNPSDHPTYNPTYNPAHHGYLSRLQATGAICPSPSGLPEQCTDRGR